MSLLKISWRFMKARKWVTLATLLALILPVMLTVILLVVRDQTEGALKRDAGKFDLVVGAKGGAMQLVLSSLYHLGMPTGNIPYKDYETLRADERVRTAVPIGLGDNYEGYRIVGTEPHFFQVADLKGEPLFSLREGQVFHPDGFQAVIGNQVARQAGLKIGDVFYGTHGLLTIPGAEVHTDFKYEVVGILEPSGSALDRAIYVPISAVWKVHHAEESIHQVFKGAQPIKKEVTAVLVQLESAGLRLWMLDEIRKETNLMAAAPLNEVLSLSEVYLAPFQRLLLLVTIGVVLVSALVILLSLFQAVERREKSLLILRSLGATRREVSLTLLYEILLLILLGVAGGWFLGHLLVQLLSGVVYERTGLILKAWALAPSELPVLGCLMAVLLLISAVPLISLYRKSVLS